MRTGPIHRPSVIRPVYHGHRGKHLQRSRIRASDLPAIAACLGITVEDIIELGRAA